MAAPVLQQPAITAIDTDAIAIVATDSDGITGVCKGFSEPVPNAEVFGPDVTAINGIGNIVATKALVKIHIARCTFGNIAKISGEIIVVVYVADPGIIGAISELVTLGGGAGLRMKPAANKQQADNK